jgi:DNA repair exonuclease SbcCD nuclease subunit
LILAGDLYDGDWNDYSTGLFFVQQMTRLREADVQVVWLRGNHDAASRLTQHLRPPDNVHELGHGRPVTLELELDGVAVAVHGQGFAKAKVTDDLSARYPAPLMGALNVGVLHTALDGREGHDRYAPCRAEALANKGYDYWALGHVHRREVVASEPWIVFPGNLQGRHARETGPKGATLVSAPAGRIGVVEHRALDEVRWAHARVDAEPATSADDVVDLVREELLRELEAADGRLLCVRIIVSGATAAHGALRVEREQWEAEIRSQALDVARDAAWVEQVVLETRPVGDPALLRARQDPVGALLRRLDALRADDAALEGLAAELSELRRKLPRDIVDGPDAPRLAEPAALRSLLDDVEGLLLPMLGHEQEES